MRIIIALVVLLLWAPGVLAQQLTLTWVDNSDETASFVIQRAPATTGPWVLLGYAPVSDTDYVDQAVVWEIRYCYRVAAQDAKGARSGWSNIACGTAHAPPTTATFTIMKTGSGTVTSSPAGITCGSVCSKTFGIGTVVTFTASPATGYKLSGWYGWGCGGTGLLCKVTITKPGTVWAYFTTVP